MHGSAVIELIFDMYVHISVGPVKVTDMDAFSSTHFHMAEDYAVERAQSPEQVNNFLMQSPVMVK